MQSRSRNDLLDDRAPTGSHGAVMLLRLRLGWFSRSQCPARITTDVRALPVIEAFFGASRFFGVGGVIAYRRVMVRLT